MLRQSHVLKQNLNILPQQIQMLGIYHLNLQDLEQRVRDELDENPLLETTAEEENEMAPGDESELVPDFQNWEEYGYDDIPNYGADHQNYIHNSTISIPIKELIDFRSQLKQQLLNLNLSEPEYDVACFILDCISDNGYLEQSVSDLADDYCFINNKFVKEEIIIRILKKLQQMEPRGIACQNIREFLLLQLQDQRQCPIVKKAIQLLSNHYDDLKNQHFKMICAALNIDEEELSIILKHISKLQLNPTNIVQENQPLKNGVVADFVLIVEGESLMVELCRQKSPSLFINQSVLKGIDEKEFKSASEKSASFYLKNKLASAQWFIDAIRMREENMLKIVREIIRMQRDYFLSGEFADLKPMILKNISDKVGLDISTISRVTCNKYIDTPFGMILLKDLFTQAIVNESGLTVSNKVVQINLKKIIDTEDRDNPYNDKQLVLMLAEKGIKIARRTVSKYREQLNIPVGNMRRIWSKVS